MLEIDELMEEDLRLFEEMNRKRAQLEEEEEVGMDLGDMDIGFDDDYYEWIWINRMVMKVISGNVIEYDVNDGNIIKYDWIKLMHFYKEITHWLL